MSRHRRRQPVVRWRLPAAVADTAGAAAAAAAAAATAAAAAVTIELRALSEGFGFRPAQRTQYRALDYRMDKFLDVRAATRSAIQWN